MIVSSDLVLDFSVLVSMKSLCVYEIYRHEEFLCSVSYAGFNSFVGEEPAKLGPNGWMD